MISQLITSSRNLCLNAKTPIFVKEKLLKLKLDIESHTLIMRDFDNPFSLIDSSFRHKFSKEITELTDIIDQMDLTGIYRLFHPNTKEYISSQHLIYPSPKFTILLITKHASTETGKLK